MPDKHPAAVAAPPSQSLFTTGRRVWNPVNLFVLFLIAFSWLSFFDQQTIDFIDSSLLQSLAAFATAKGLNGVIGVLESSDVTLFGAASFEIGKLLAPAKELIDQFAEVMEYVIGSLMLQKLLITISSSTFFKILLTITGLVYLLFRVFRHRYRECYQHYTLIYRIFITVLSVRFFFLLVFGLTTALDSAFIANTTQQKIESIEDTPAEVDPTGQISPEEQAERRHLDAQILQLTEQQGEDQNRLLVLNDRIRQLKAKREDQQQALDRLDSQLGLKERYFGSDDPEKQPLLAQRETLSDALSATEQTLDEATDQRVELAREIAARSETVTDLEQARENIGQGTLAMMRSLGVDFIRSAKDKLEAAANTALELTVLFIFKSILMPLLFIFAGYKLFIRVWNYDVRTLRQTDWPSMTGSKDRIDSKKSTGPDTLPAP